MKAKTKCRLTIHRALIAIALLLSSGASASALGQPDSSSQSFTHLAQSALSAMRDSHPAEATRLFRRAVTLRPKWAEGWWYLGTMAFDAGHFNDARDAFVHFVSVEHREPGPGFGMLGLCEFQLHHYKRAQNALERGRVLGLGDNWDFTQTVLYHDGILYTLFGQPEVALQRLTRVANRLAAAHSDDPIDAVLNNTALLNALGLAALRIRKLPSHIGASQASLVQLAGHAQALVALQDRDPAGAEMKKIVALYPSQPGVHYMYGVFLLKADPPLAVHQFKREIQVSPSSSAARIQLAFAYLSTAHYRQGLQYAQKAVALAPKNFAAHVVCGRLWLGLGKTDEAIAQLKTAVKLAPDSPDAHFALARAFAMAGKSRQAAHQRSEFQRLKKLQNSASRQ